MSDAISSPRPHPRDPLTHSPSCGDVLRAAETRTTTAEAGEEIFTAVSLLQRCDELLSAVCLTPVRCFGVPDQPRKLDLDFKAPNRGGLSIKKSTKEIPSVHGSVLLVRETCNWHPKPSLPQFQFFEKKQLRLRLSLRVADGGGGAPSRTPPHSSYPASLPLCACGRTDAHHRRIFSHAPPTYSTAAFLP